jgi:hypothetical protein
MIRLDYESDNKGLISIKYFWPARDYTSNSQRILQLVLEDPDSHSDIGGNWTLGTLSTILSAEQLSNSLGPTYDVKYQTLMSAGTHWTLQTSQPVVMSTCSPISNHINNITYFHVNGSTSILQNATELYDTMSKINADYTSFMSWIQMPQDPTSLLALFMSYTCSANDSEADSSGNDSVLEGCFTVCTVSSFWWDTFTSLSLDNTVNLIQTDWPRSKKDIIQDKSRPIIINPESITTLDLSEYIQSPLDELHEGEYLSLAEVIVAPFLAALSRVPGQDTRKLYTSIPEYMIEGMNSSSIEDSTSYMSLRIVRKTTGYGYGGTGTSTQLSLAVIAAYCFITIVYVIYIVVTGHTSIAWNSATELIILALQSKEPDGLGHVSVGIDTTETLRRSVGIRVNTMSIGDTGEHMEKLELVFEHDGEHRRTLKKVKRNQAY